MRAFVVDAFTDRAFAGNPAGVVLLDEPADPIWMQQVAAELRHAETAFVQPRDGDGYELRWFTPTVEVDLCGHATLATAHVLQADGSGGPWSFHTRSGVLGAAAGSDGDIVLDFPARPVQAVPAPAELSALGVPVTGTYLTDERPESRDFLVTLDSAATVAGLTPDIAELALIPCRGIIVTATSPQDADHDIVSRFFAPRAGVDEDPVTGSAHCALAPFWAQRLGRDRLIAVQLSARGGRLDLEVRGDRVAMTGHAVTVLAGELRSPDAR